MSNIIEDIKNITNGAERDVTAKLGEAERVNYQGDFEKVRSKIDSLYVEALSSFEKAKSKIKSKWEDVINERRYAKHLGYELLISEAQSKLRESIDVCNKIKEEEERIKELEEDLSNAEKIVEHDMSFNDRFKKLEGERKEIEDKIQKVRIHNSGNGGEK